MAVGLVLVIVTAVAVAAFGGGAGKATTAKRSADTKTLVVAVPSDIQNLDPTLSSADIATQELLTNVYDWLIDYKVVKQGGTMIGSPNSFVGAIAKSFTWNADPHGHDVPPPAGHQVRERRSARRERRQVHLRPDLQAGRRDRVPHLDGGRQGSGLGHRSSIPTTVTIDVTKPNTLLLGNMAQFGHSILDPKVVNAHATTADPYAHNWLGSNVDGTAQGPFILQSWQHGSQWVLAKNPNYYGQKPKVDKVIFKVIPNASSRLALLKSGAVDIAYDLPLKDVKALETDPNIQVIRHPSRFVVFLGMNSKVKPFNNVKVRQAISYATPYQTIISQVLQGFGRQLTSPIPFGTPTHTDKFFVYKTDYTKAKQLLTEAGYPNGFTTTLYVASGVDEGTETAVWVQQSLAKIGIKLQIQQLPGANFTSRLQKHQLSFFFFNNWISINNDPFYHLYWLFRSDCCDYTNYANKSVWKTIDANLLANPGAARDAAAVSAQKQIMADAPWVFLYQPDFVLAMRKNVHGYVYYSSDRFTRYKFIYKTAS